MVNVLFVCLGNICRSPTAEGVFLKLVADAGLSSHIRVDSCGTAGWHQGRAPDSRTIATAKKRNYDLSTLRARQVIVGDFAEFDYILAMDTANLRDLKQIAPVNYSGHLGLLLEFGSHAHREVPDPYHGDSEDFEQVLDLVEVAAQNLLQHIRKQHAL